ncbi:MAG: TOBE domain-containing protein [Chloroflexi bacterium]|uniref:TOBE domain-containing protein n=1 Tax=Candidatus Chlorohelix allophototropha TaxID=3003348 RepID=A0A8T7M9N6_9CHLR|nr:TOBE domain-containing protein [Chloroflexota bacterium]WJW68685.1 TOBE domain-containing protein [Chloroflexota bacterium L227-S17]
MKISARNQLKGTVKEVKLGAIMAEILVELATGEELVSVITRNSAVSLDLKVGDTVAAVIKSTEVMIGKE